MEAALGEGITASLAWHLTKYDDLIAWFDADGDPNTWWDGSYQNISMAETEGVDLSLDAHLGKTSIGINGSWLRTRDDQGEELFRRPDMRLGTRIGYAMSNGITINADATYVGERKDWGNVTLDSHTLVNLAGAWRLSEIFQIFGRVQNLTDEEYEEAGGYGTPGRSAYLGVKADL